jgi:glycosyltransferase involved in cell wall biosynthesis
MATLTPSLGNALQLPLKQRGNVVTKEMLRNVRNKEALAQAPERKPKVSIMLITYNHEKYIAQTLESILTQETEYDYEINVIEDCSTDGTQDIVMQYAKQYPDKVKPYFNEKNIGFKITQKNSYRGFKTLTGDYIAIIEGDDYWSSPHKLQKQVSFLEDNPGYVACAHNVIKVYEDGSREPHRFLYWEGTPEDHTIEDVIFMRAYFHITTLMFRNVFKGVPPCQFENRWSCEIFVTIAHAQFGKIRYFDEDMSVYRTHAGGRFSNMKILDSWFFNIGGLRRYNAWLGYRHLKAFSGSIVRYCNVVLRDAGTEWETEPLTMGQTLKYAGIQICYQFIYGLLDTRDMIKSVYDERLKNKPLALRLLLVPWYTAILVLRGVMAIPGAILSCFYWCARIVIPALYRKSLRKFTASRLPEEMYCKIHNTFPLRQIHHCVDEVQRVRASLQHEDIRALRWLWKEGRLFTPHGGYHFKRAVRLFTRSLWLKLARLTARSMPESLKRTFWPIGTMNERMYRVIYNTFALRPIRYCVDTAQRVRTSPKHDDIRALRWLWKQGQLFTPKGMHHFREATGSYARALWFGICALPYRVVALLAPASFRDTLRRLDTSHEGLRRFRQLLREGRFLTRTGALHCVDMARGAIHKALHSKGGPVKGPVLSVHNTARAAAYVPPGVRHDSAPEPRLAGPEVALGS